MQRGVKILSFSAAMEAFQDVCICIGSLWTDEIKAQIYKYDATLLDKTVDFSGAMVWEIKRKIFESTELHYVQENKNLFEYIYIINSEIGNHS